MFRRFGLISFKTIFCENSLTRKMCSKCFVKSVESEANVIISFNYSFDSSFQRFFKLKRNKSETLGQTFTRISLNINNILTKKSKKNKNKCEIKQNIIEIQLISDGIKVSEDSLNDRIWKSGQTLKVGDNIFDVILNPPTVNSLSLPKCILSTFTVYPKVLLEFCSTKDCKYFWFKKQFNENESKVKESTIDQKIKSETNTEEWIPIGDGFYYKTTNADIGYKLKVICIPNNGIQSEAISVNPVEANPGLCPFEKRHLFCKSNCDLDSFRITTYNILANTYVDSEYSRNVLFPYCPPYALNIDYRKQLIIKELIGYNSDVYCLQEVDREVFVNDLKPIFSSLPNDNTSQQPKYESIYSEKGSTGEGLAVFFNNCKFELLQSKDISYAEEIQSNPIFKNLLSDISINPKLLERILSRKSIFQCLLLKSLENSDYTILLGNTHLYFHPDADHIRLLQSFIFVKYMENIIKDLSKERPHLKVSPILCGDFNSCPEFGVLMLITTGFVHKDIEDFKSNSDQTIQGFDMSHTLSLSSACGQPIYTNYTPFFNGCLDYIFFDTKCLEVLEVIPFPSHEEVTENTALPSVVFPSDHLPLICSLKWKHF